MDFRICFLSSTIFYFSTIFLLSSTSAQKTILDDQNALNAFKAHITLSHPNNILSLLWSNNIPTCKWEGVSCSIRRQRVTALDLSYMNLTSTISPHLSNLSFLSSLILNFNNFHGFLPVELAKLRRLQHLNLQCNSFSGELPMWLGNFQHLKEFILSNNSFTGLIPSSVFNISSLRVLKLVANDLTGSLPENICDNLPQLETFSVAINSLHGQTPANLYKCSRLQVLSLSYNQFNGSIPRQIGNLTDLRELYLGFNNFEGETIPWEIGNLVHLERLDIPSASLTGSIPSSIFNLSSLISLDLENNSLSGSLPQDLIFNLPALQKLSFAHNHLKGQIPLSLCECIALQILVLNNNEFTGSIPKQIGNLTSLWFFYMNFNKMTGTLPDEIGNLKLKFIVIGNNSFTGPVPYGIFNISTLRYLDVQFNNLSGHLPADIRLPNLEELSLNSNKFGGPIPCSITNASKISVIQLYHNYFDGPIPDTLGNLKFLKNLHLSGNRLTTEFATSELSFLNSLTNCKLLETLTISQNYLGGFIPNSVGNLSTSLYYFEAYGSNIKGRIPVEIGNLSGLQVLELYGNELTGTIPTTIGRLTELGRLTLAGNRLQGSIPSDLCDIKRIGELDLGQNRLSGSIPTCMGELITLEKLNLYSNELNFTIPSNFWSLSKLIHLNLSSNRLIGNITPDIGNLNIATQIDLSRNQLSGDIPTTVGKAQELNFLSLAHNKLQGSIPETLSDLKGLEFLDLSANNLSGEIPHSLGKIRYLQYLNLSFNMLQGEIPTTGSFANFPAESFSHNIGLCGARWITVPHCKPQSVKKSKSKLVHLLKYILPPMLSILFICFVVYIWVIIYKKNPHLPIENESSLDLWRRFSHYDLQRATESFSEDNLLGTGGFASVFKGTLSDGTTAAVKVFNMQHEEAMTSFDRESEVLVKIRHRNLLRIISSCSNLDFRALVLEYMPNGSLDKWLHLPDYCLDILQRLNIMTDVANAIEYLHYGQTTQILHCDLKPSNVLLDEDMIAHVSDFGIAKLLGDEEFRAQTQTLGTVGYMAPEYGSEGIISSKGDVYSYGVVLMEAFTRKKPTDEMFSGKMDLRSWVNETLHGNFPQVVDSKLMMTRLDEHTYAEEQCVTCILDLALNCSTDSVSERITMKEVLYRLEKIRVMFEISTKASN